MSLSNGFLYSNDIAGQYPDSYYAATANALPPFPQQAGDESADVCIIGAGFTGLSAALHLAQAGYKTIVLDAHRVGWGASGRNGGQLGAGQRVDQDALESSYGKEMARAMWDLAKDSILLCRDLINTHQIDCDLKDGIIHADHKQRYVAESQEYAEKLQTEYDHQAIRFLDQEEIRHLVGSPAYYGGTLDMSAAHVHPLNFALGLAKAAQAAGAIIYENSQVLSYSKTDPAVVTLKNGTIKAKHVILACNGYLDDLDKHVAARVMPINNYILATEPLSEEQKQSLIRNDHAVADSKFVVNYYRFSDDNRLLFGGGESYSFKFPSDIKSFVRKEMLKIYPQLENTQIDYGWGGTLGITVSRLPYMKQLAPNVLSSSGYSGHGVAMATFAGKMLADTIDGTMTQFDVMSKVRTYPFPGGTMLRYPLLVAAMSYYALRDRL